MVHGLGRTDCIWYNGIYLCVMACVLFQILISFSVMKIKSDEFFAVSHTHRYRINIVPFFVPNPCSVIHLE